MDRACRSPLRATRPRCRVAAANTRDSLRRVRVAARATLARPSMLALVAGAAALFGFWLARRPQPQTAFSSDTATVGPTTSAAGVALAFILRNAIQPLPFIL